MRVCTYHHHLDDGGHDRQYLHRSPVHEHHGDNGSASDDHHVHREHHDHHQDAVDDDGDHCTDERCDPVRGYVYGEVSATTPSGALCAVANLRDAVRRSTLCARHCLRTVAHCLVGLERAIARASAGRSLAACRRQMHAAMRLARALERHLPPTIPGQVDESGAAATQLRRRVGALAAGVCRRPR